MRYQGFVVVLLLWLGAPALVANGGAVVSMTRGFAVADPALMPPSPPALSAPATTGAQDPAAVEASLGLDRSARRLIQQELRNEGFDPGTPDGLFGPRTRAAIRRWQASQGTSPSGYLDGSEAELLRAAGSTAAAGTGDITPRISAVAESAPPVVDSVSPVAESAADSVVAESASPVAEPVSPVAESAAEVDPESLNCDEWNTRPFFETAAPSTVTACAAGGADVAAVGKTNMFSGDDSPLHMAATFNENPAVVEALLAAGADVAARNDRGSTALHMAAGFNENPAVVDALLAAGADVAARNERGSTPLDFALQRYQPLVTVEGTLAEVMLAAAVDVWSARNALLRAAAFNGSPADVEGLLAAGADANDRGSSEQTPLHYAAQNNENPAVVRILLSAGAAVLPSSRK